jgi:N-glycosylase/DNA lyase
VDYSPVVFPSHIGKVFHVKIVCLVLVVFGYIFSAYILLYFIVSYRFTQRGSFVYCCFSQHKVQRKLLACTRDVLLTKFHVIGTIFLKQVYFISSKLC